MKRNVYLLIILLSFVFTQAQEAITPDRALEMLKEGNKRYLEGKTSNLGTYEARRLETKSSQSPFATVLGCSDSRVPIEIIFDQGIGNIFKIAVAGNVMNKHEIGSVEYAVGHLKSPLLVVLGHTKCGAVTAAATDAVLHGSIPSLIADIKPAVEKAKEHNHGLTGADLVPPSIHENVFYQIENLLTKSKEAQELVKEGKLKVVGAIYNIETGAIEWLGTHPNQESLIKTEVKEEHAIAEHKEGEPNKEEAKPLVLSDISDTMMKFGLFLAGGFFVLVIPSFFLVLWLFDWMKKRHS